MPSLNRLTLLVAILIAPLSAQETWSVVASPTTRNLWSVTSGAGLFVAVGDGGIILTSPDGATWTSRPSGVTDWLVGIAHVNHLFVAVGDKGTLLTSPDGLSWTSRSSGVTERLNAVAHGDDCWLAVGENGAAVTSTDGLTWTAVAPPTYRMEALSGWLRGLCFAYGTFVTTGQRGHIATWLDGSSFADKSIATAANLESLAYGRHRFVAVGDDGLVLTSFDATTWRGSLAPTALRAIAFFNNTFVAAASNGSILTSPDASAWTSRSTGNSHLLTALAADTSTIVAVGFGGAILRASAAQTRPSVVTPPADTTEAAGNHVLLSVTATGTAPLAYQWSRDGRPLPGATGDTLPLLSINTAQAGRYTVTVSNHLGTFTSPVATLTVVPAFEPPADVFDSTFVPPSFRQPPTALLALPDGKILTANPSSIDRLLPDGAPDPTFTLSSIAGAANIEALARQPDGGILVGGSTTAGTSFLSRLHDNGSPDVTFSTSALGGPSVTDIAIQPDGKILVANNTARLVRLNPDGSPDATFAASDLSRLFPDATLSPLIQLVALASDGRIVVAAGRAQEMPSAPSSPPRVLVVRLLTDGSLDPTFTHMRTENSWGTALPRLLSVRPDRRILIATQHTTGAFNSGYWAIQRLNPDGGDDATFLRQQSHIGKYGGNMRASLDSTGRIIVAVGQQNATPQLRLARFHPDGSPDTTLRAEESGYGSFQSLIHSLAPLPDGRVLLSRQFGLHRLVAANAPRLNPPVPLADNPSQPLIIVGGTSATIQARAAGSGPFTYEWYSPNYSRTDPSDSITIHNVRVDTTVRTILSNPAGALTLPPRRIHVPPSAPVIVRAPGNISAGLGRAPTISFDALGSGPLTYQWLFDGTVIRSETSSAWAPPYSSSDGHALFREVSATTVGTYELILTNPLGTARHTFTLSIDPSSRLVDLSARGFIDSVDASIIAGFVIDGPSSKYVLIRGVGPGLAPFGITDFLANPKLALFDSSGRQIEENDNWIGNAESYSTHNWPATFSLTPGSRDAIVSASLPPGNYTARLTGVDGATGTALLEVYEDIHAVPRLSNLSTRLFVGPSPHAAIAGFVVGAGSLPKKILLRAIGPSLAPFGVPSPLANPMLTLRDATGAVITTNDNWDGQPALASAFAATGAFPLSSSSKDSALLVTLPPGSYTAQVSGVNNTTGVALVEVYEVP